MRMGAMVTNCLGHSRLPFIQGCSVLYFINGDYFFHFAILTRTGMDGIDGEID